MKLDRVKDIADAVLYEGYILYPYRPSAIKNRQRWTFGGVFPRDYDEVGGESSTMRTEILICATADAEVDGVVRCLQTQMRQVSRPISPDASANEPLYEPVAALEVEGKQFVSWEEAIEREVISANIAVADLTSNPKHIDFAFPAQREISPIHSKNGQIAGVVTRTCEALEGFIEIAAKKMDDSIYRLSVLIGNTTPLPDPKRVSRSDAQRYAFMSTHTIALLRNGEFVSLLDPPENLQEASRACNNQGTWPVLVGDDGDRDIVLSSPIILYDYPKVAPESNGPFFDGAEIDELLTLRVLTLTDDEKKEMAAADPRTRSMLARCESLTAMEFANLHGAFRTPTGSQSDASVSNSKQSPRRVEEGLSVGGHVRLDPKRGGDIMDIVLKGKVGVIEAIERDFEDRLHVAVTLLDDPGGDLGAAGFPGHRFYFSREEIEPIEAGEAS